MFILFSILLYPVVFCSFFLSLSCLEYKSNFCDPFPVYYDHHMFNIEDALVLSIEHVRYWPKWWLFAVHSIGCWKSRWPMLVALWIKKISAVIDSLYFAPVVTTGGKNRYFGPYGLATFFHLLQNDCTGYATHRLLMSNSLSAFIQRNFTKYSQAFSVFINVFHLQLLYMMTQARFCSHFGRTSPNVFRSL